MINKNYHLDIKMRFNPKKHNFHRRLRPSESDVDMRRIWVDGEYCPFHSIGEGNRQLKKENFDKIKFIHSSTVNLITDKDGKQREVDGSRRFFKYCPKCLVTLFYKQKSQVETPKILIPNENTN